MVPHSKIRKNLIVATGGGGQTGLDILSFANIGPDKNRYFAQVFVGWLFIGITPDSDLELTAGFTLWYLTRELLLFKKIRQEYLRRPEVASQIVQRTILLTSIPQDMFSVAKLTEIFGPHVEKVYINRNYKELEKLVEDRNEDANILEGAENKLIKTVNKLAIKKGRKEVPENYDKNISTLYIKDKKRPHHKLGKPVINLLFGKKVPPVERENG
jgi:calcium permeable stress-gated cation channel